MIHVQAQKNILFTLDLFKKMFFFSLVPTKITNDIKTATNSEL